MVTCWLWVSGTAWQGLSSLEPLAAARVMYIVHDYCTDCSCSSVLLLRLNTQIVMLAAFFSWPNAQFEEGWFWSCCQTYEFMAPFHLLNLICWGIFNIIMETVTIFTPYRKLSVRQSMRREFQSNKYCTKLWCLHFFRRNGLNELTGSLPVPETWTSQGTELEHSMLGKQ